MFRAHDQVERVIPQFFGRQRRLHRGRQRHDRELEVAPRDGGTRLLRIHETQIKVNARKGAVESLQRGRKSVQSYVVACGECERPGDLAGQVGDRAANVLKLAKQSMRSLEQSVSRLGETNPATDAVEQGSAKFRFQACNAFANRRLSEEKALGRARKGPGLRNCEKSLKFWGIHNYEK
jgi:hypothetical protein